MSNASNAEEFASSSEEMNSQAGAMLGFVDRLEGLVGGSGKDEYMAGDEEKTEETEEPSPMEEVGHVKSG